jgi:glutamate 5-kinase
VKVGTAVVSKPNGKLALSRMGGLVENIGKLAENGKQVLLVSSGAVGVGRQRTGLPKDLVQDPTNVIDRQACAAAGQEVLMSTYDMMFNRCGLKCAQVLITQSDFLDRERFISLTRTIERLSSMGIVPIINENDVVTGTVGLAAAPSVFNDNDMLSALVAAGSEADGLALLTDVEAVFDKPPDQKGAKRISVYVPEQNIEIGTKSTMGRGGMASKIEAASLAAEGGVNTVVASGNDTENIRRIFDGEDVGTLFQAQGGRPTKSQQWLSFTRTTSGTMKLTRNAVERIMEDPKERPITLDDIAAVNGHFDTSEPIRLLDHTGKDFGKIITRKSSEEMRNELENNAHMHIAAMLVAKQGETYTISH